MTFRLFIFLFLTNFWALFAMADSQIKPKALKKGDRVALISPGSFISDQDLERAILNIESLGLEVVLGKNIRKHRGYTAGSVEERLQDLHWAFSDDSIDAVWAARGGYGCSSLLPYIDYGLIKKHPKIFIGYSDITALHIAIMKKTGLVTFHGPVATSQFTDYTLRSVKEVLFEGLNGNEIYLSEANQEIAETDSLYRIRTIKGGKAVGILVGGNLTLVNSLVGTPWELDYSKKILFLEDVSEKPYRIDRMLVQMKQNQSFDKTKGIVLGVFSDCQSSDLDNSLTFEQMIDDNFLGLKVPSAYGFSFGHIDNQICIPMGIKAEVDFYALTIKYLESPLKK